MVQKGSYKNLSVEELHGELLEIQEKYNSLKSIFEKEMIDKKDEKIILEKLIIASEELIQLQENPNNFGKILQMMLDISGASYAALNIFDANGLDFRTVAVAGLNENLKKGMSFLGFDLIGKHWSHDPLRAQKTKNKTITRYERLHDLTNDVISRTVVLLLEKTFNLGDTFIVKVSKQDKVLGDFTLMFHKEVTLSNPKLVNLYVQQVGLFLDRNRMINTIRESEVRHSSMISNISDIICIAGSDGKLNYVSPNIEKWFGWKPDDLVGCNAWFTVHPDDRERFKGCFMASLEKENSLLSVEYTYRCKDGSNKPVELSAINLSGNPIINGILLNYHDITDRKKTEEEIRSKNEELLKSNAEKDKFFSIIAHDLRNPLSSFLSLSQLLADRLSSFTIDETQEVADNMKTSANNLFILLENLHEWSRIKQGLVAVNIELIPLLLIVNETIETIGDPAKLKGISIDRSFPEDLKVYTDSNILQTILRNLLSNAIKFTPRGGKIDISARNISDNGVEISVRDSGIGMSPKLVDNLFRLDIQTKRKGTEGELSSGLGLIICKDLIEKQGGKIWVESKEKEGSVFRFNLPCNSVPELVTDL
jgi:PAS domain S-box-containing protein